MNPDLIHIPLHRLAHGRAGDKGDTANISVIAYREEFFPVLLEQVKEEKVREVFRNRNPTAVRRYLLPRLCAVTFVLEDLLDGGANDLPNVYAHGKKLAFLLLSMEVAAPKELAALLDPAMTGEAECLRP